MAHLENHETWNRRISGMATLMSTIFPSVRWKFNSDPEFDAIIIHPACLRCGFEGPAVIRIFTTTTWADVQGQVISVTK